MDKVLSSIEECLEDVKDGAVIAIPGFFTCGVPRALLQGLIKKGVKNLTLTCGCGPLVGCKEETAALVKNGQLKKVVDSYGLPRSASAGRKDPFESAVREGTIEFEVSPMGTLAERYRAGGAGIPAFYTPTGVGSFVQEIVLSSIPENRTPKETKVINGKTYILEYAIQPDFAFIHAQIGDREGNLRYAKTALNFNAVMATAAKVTIAEVENIVEIGELKADDVHTPGIYVKKMVKVERPKVNVGID
ncbi:MAG: CoA transferase subunit A [Dehalococcoidales bacterium]|jgi:3-oxoacid CoA-transferase A subunit|nr:CoA transferase subunit A [Dehalococcoidales bacterium]